MIKNKESLVKQFRSDDPSTYLSSEGQQKAMLLETLGDMKPKKRVVEPIEIPEIISVPRRQPIKKIRYTGLPKSYDYKSYTERTVGLSREFTQDKIREGQISKELDREMAIDERKNNQNKNRRKLDRQV